ncbi:MAG: response regulator transcription factor [Chitinophagales bacterium]|jgi:two-component system alkaline phosphatase synthesis response regulator PhoP|nr:response regulator transcription factor [Sphingobacteriales bacterium]
MMELEGAKILLVDDEGDILEFLEHVLSKAGAKVITGVNGQEAIDLAQKHNPDIIILDKMMPVMDGVKACAELKKIESLRKTKIVMLSAISDIDSQIEGLDLGADDYLVKPIKSNLLVSKIKSQLRQFRTLKQDRPEVIEYKHIKIDRSKFIVSMGEKEISLPKKEFELLYLLMSQPDNVFRREDILETVWGKDVYIGDRTIDVHIRKIREKIGDDYFKTIKGIGYKFVAF